MKTLTFNQTIEECDSTNDLAKSLGLAGCPHGTWISAKIQNQGRGRQDRKWISLEGNLFFSMVVRIHDSSLWTWIPLVAGLACAEAIEMVHPEFEIKLKWPNDLLLSGSKVGGILCEGVTQKDGAFVVVGIGLNCLKAPENIDQKAIHLNSSRVDAIREELIFKLIEKYKNLEQEGPMVIRAFYKNRAIHSSGVEITWNQGGGKFVDIDSRGGLVVELPDGSHKTLIAEEISQVRATPKASV